MSLAKAIFGAKPLYGTPPFAGPVPQTGGTDPVPSPGEPQHGIAGFIDRVFNPTNSLGQFGQALFASGGDPSQAMAYLMQSRAAAAKPDQDFAEFRRKYDYEAAHPKPPTAQPYRFEANNGDVYQLDAEGKPQRIFEDPTPKMNFIPDGLGGGQWVAVPTSAPGGLAPAGTLGAADEPVIEDGYQYTPGPGGKANKANWSPLAAGGAVSNGGGRFPDPMKAPGHMTSGRRTVAGNRAVGGVPNSHHLSGDAADYAGASMGELRAYFGPNARYLDEGDHIHVTLPGYGLVPYFGRRGAMGAR